MKGIVHFSVGAAVATFFPQAIELAQSEMSWIIVLGGAFGLLPDTLDFKFYRFFTHNDYVIDPDPKNPQPQKIADKIASVIEEAYVTGKEKRVQLHTMRLGVNLWRRYSIGFDQKNNQVIVQIGPVVDTSQAPYPESEPKENFRGIAKIKAGKIYQALDKVSSIDILSGPAFGFQKKGENVEMIFLPWHRTWSHSLTMGIYLGIAGWLFMGMFIGLKKAVLYGLIILLSFWAHVIVDLSGFMGGNLFWPFTKRRTRGFGVLKASNPIANFLTVWASVLAIIFNLNRFGTEQVFNIPWYLYFLFGLIIPGTILILLSYFFGEKEEKRNLASLKQAEAKAETEENFA